MADSFIQSVRKLIDMLNMKIPSGIITREITIQTNVVLQLLDREEKACKAKKLKGSSSTEEEISQMKNF